jgi:hypothetical protein
VEVYCHSWEVDYGSGEGARQMQADLERIQAELEQLQTSPLTKLSLQLILFRKLALQSHKFRRHFLNALQQYEEFQHRQALADQERPT